MKVVDKGLIVKMLISGVLSFIFGWFGLVFMFGVLFGREVSQVEYRFIEKGHKWKDITWKVYFDVENWKARNGRLLDTLLDVGLPLLVGLLILMIRRW